MGCSNTKFPLAAVADRAGVNPLNMVNSMEPPQVIVEAGDKLINQASDALSQASQALETASETIAKNNPFGDTSSVKLEEAETEDDKQTINTVEEDPAGEENATEETLDSADNDDKIDFLAICPPEIEQEGEASEEGEKNEESAEVEGEDAAEAAGEEEEEKVEDEPTDEPTEDTNDETEENAEEEEKAEEVEENTEEVEENADKEGE